MYIALYVRENAHGGPSARLQLPTRLIVDGKVRQISVLGLGTGISVRK